MPSSGVSYDQVVAVAERLSGEGQPVTLRGVRGALGTGSLSTIRAHVERWRHSRASAPTRHELSSSVLKALNDEIAARANELISDRDRKIEQQREELETMAAEITRLNERIDELENESVTHQRMSGRLQEIEEELGRSRRETQEARTATEQARRELAIALVAAERLHVVETNLARAQSELRELERTSAMAVLDAEKRAARAEGQLAGTKR